MLRKELEARFRELEARCQDIEARDDGLCTILNETETRLATATALLRRCHGWSGVPSRAIEAFLAGQPAAPETDAAHPDDYAAHARWNEPAAPTRTECTSPGGPNDCYDIDCPSPECNPKPTRTEAFDITTPECAAEEYHRISEDIQERDATRTEAEQAVLDACKNALIPLQGDGQRRLTADDSDNIVFAELARRWLK